MGLISFALKRPVSLVILILGIALASLFAIQRMPRDIFPDLGVPTLYLAQPYGGMDPAKMEGYLTYYYEFHFLFINGIEHVESKSVQGAALLKIQFHPGTDMAQALAETVSYTNRARAFMPPGTVPPFIMRFDAGSVPVGYLVFSSPNRSVSELQDAALNRVRPLFATLPGVSAPPPMGASQRSIVIRADPEKLRAYNMSPDEIVRAVTEGNLVAASGNVRVGDTISMVPINSVVSNIKDLNNVGIRADGTRTIFVRDVATVEDGADIQTGYAFVDGRQTVYIPVTKHADASTLSVVNLVKQNLSKFQAILPDDIRVEYQFDQAPYVTRAIGGLVFEGAIGAVLTAIMVLLFLWDWRSAVIVVLNIPLAILASVLVLWLTGATINIMTLGGLALAVGILVDQTVVTIENVHTHFRAGKGIARAARDGTAETMWPQLLAMLCILAVFTPALFMTGAARNLFVPLALAVGFAQIASYLLSSTLVPILSIWFLGKHQSQERRETRFATLLRDAYRDLSRGLLRVRYALVPAYLAVSALIIVLIGNGLGAEIFPNIDTGQMQLRLRAPAGTRIEQTREVTFKTLEAIKEAVGPEKVEITRAFVGVTAPNYPVNLIYQWTSGSEEALINVQLKPNSGVRVSELQERLRKLLPEKLPGVTFSFEPADIINQVMSFGSQNPIEIGVTGPSLADSRAYAEKLRAELAKIPTVRDLGYQQALDYPSMAVNVDRERASVMGVTVADVARSVVSGTSSSRYVAANYWADPNSGIAYQVQVEIPEQQLNSLAQLENIPVAQKTSGKIGLRDVANVTETKLPGEYDRYNSQRSITLGANVYGETLGQAAKRIDQAIKNTGAPPQRVTVAVRGQITTMQDLFDGLQTGLLIAIVVILLLLSANFQSFRLSLTVVLTLPAVLAGIVIALKATGTTLNIESLMGAIMAVGVSVANAILLVTFAERSRLAGKDAREAALDGAQGRVRPILMTTFAMIAGMIPMAIGLGGGGEQTTALGIAVIGGLAGSLVATLLVLPSLFAMMQRKRSRKSASIDPGDPNSRWFEPEQPASEARA